MKMHKISEGAASLLIAVSLFAACGSAPAFSAVSAASPPANSAASSSAGAPAEQAKEPAVSAKVELTEGVYFDDVLYGMEPGPKTNNEITISNITGTSFDFTVNTRTMATDTTEEIFPKSTAVFIGDGTTAVYYGDNETITFTFPDNHKSLPVVTDITVKGLAEIEGATFVNNSIPGHEFG